MPYDVPPSPRTRGSARARQGPNALLSALPAATYAALVPHLSPVSLAGGDVLCTAGAPIGDVYFPDSAVLSMLARLADGTIVEVGTVGSEGFVGLPVLFGVGTNPTDCVAQVPGAARRLSADALAGALGEAGPLRDVLLRYAHAYLHQVAQASACNVLHPIVERCARWLLAADDTAGSDDGAGGRAGFELKQEYLAHLLGVRREGVSGAASALRDAGLIRFSRGHITVTDRPGLEAASCECYGTVVAEYVRALGPIARVGTRSRR